MSIITKYGEEITIERNNDSIDITIDEYEGSAAATITKKQAKEIIDRLTKLLEEKQ
jgi:hypothetical protein